MWQFLCLNCFLIISFVICFFRLFSWFLLAFGERDSQTKLMNDWTISEREKKSIEQKLREKMWFEKWKSNGMRLLFTFWLPDFYSINISIGRLFDPFSSLYLIVSRYLWLLMKQLKCIRWKRSRLRKCEHYPLSSGGWRIAFDKMLCILSHFVSIFVPPMKLEWANRGCDWPMASSKYKFWNGNRAIGIGKKLNLIWTVNGVKCNCDA